MRVSEIRVKQIRVNQGLGVHTMGFTVYSVYCAGDAFISRLTLLHYILHVVYRVLQVLFYTLRCCT